MDTDNPEIEDKGSILGNFKNFNGKFIKFLC
jgi:hypothetical protein